jgi:nucleoside-diphosphate-sugar epimerase
VRPDTRMACLSLARTVDALLHAARLASDALDWERTVLLTGIAVSADAMWSAVRRRAGSRRLGGVRFRPDSALQAVMDLVPRATASRRAASLGFGHSTSIDEIVDEYLETL